MTTYAEIWPTTNGSTTTFDLSSTMKYAASSEIHVYVDGTEQTQGTSEAPSDFYLTGTESDDFPAGDQVKMTTAPASSETLLIRRITSLTSTPVDWSDASRWTEADHDAQDAASLRRDQELSDQKGMQKALDSGHWDAEELRVTDLADPTAPQDAVTKNYLESYYSGATAIATGVQRYQYTGDGSTTDFRVVASNAGDVIDRALVLVFFDGEAVPETEYTLKAGDAEQITFTNPPGNGVSIETIVVTAANPTYSNGQLAASKLAVTEDYLITGDSSGYGSLVTRASITLDEFGSAGAAISMGGNKITDLGAPSAASDAARKADVDAIADPLDPFDTLSGTLSYSFNSSGQGDVKTNTTSYTQIIHVLFKTPSISSGKKFAAIITDDSYIMAYAQFPGAAANGIWYGSMTFAVPTGKSWRVYEIDGDDTSAWTDVKYRTATTTTL